MSAEISERIAEFLDLKIDEDFTPIVEQDGCEQDYNYLSGGKKTSLALAYRLLLNTIVQKVSSGIKSSCFRLKKLLLRRPSRAASD